MLTFAEKYGRNIYSQNGEDGIIAEILNRISIEPDDRVAIEFGGHDGFFCSNVRALYIKGWNIFQYDINPGHPDVMKKEVTPENVNNLPRCSILSIDIDGNDFEVWKNEYHVHDIVIIEINSSLDPQWDFFSENYGCNYSQMVKLGIMKGYFLLCHTGNLIFVNDKFLKYFPEVKDKDPLKDWREFFNQKWLQ